MSMYYINVDIPVMNYDSPIRKRIIMSTAGRKGEASKYILLVS